MTIKLKGIAASGTVFLNGELLSPARSQKITNHSPDGFGWGYGGSGPSQLALAILLEIMPLKQAVEKYQQFKWEKIAKLPAQKDFDVMIEV